MKFSNLGIYLRSQPDLATSKICQQLIHLLNHNLQVNLSINSNAANFVQERFGLIFQQIKKVNKQQLAQHADLIIVIGGDGSLLSAARLAILYNKPILGINRGRLGFLTDLSSHNLKAQLLPILQGHYQTEHRTLLQIDDILDQDQTTSLLENNPELNNQPLLALNDIVIANSNKARMLEFSIMVDQQFIAQQKADGILINTPTGSTAYALSAGGPIIYPTVPIISLVPLYPHTLSSRPIIIHDNQTIAIDLPSKQQAKVLVSLDGNKSFNLRPGSRLKISKYPQQLQLLHPEQYNFFKTLSAKLNWN